MGNDDHIRAEGEAGAATGATEAATGATEAATGAGAARAGGTGQAASAGAPAAEARARRERLNGILTDAERSAIYHKAREGFLGSCHRWTMFLVLLSSSGAVLALTQGNAIWQKALALVPALLGALDMTLAFGQQAREHAMLARRFLDLAADVSEEDAQVSVGDLDGRLYRIYSEEPPTFRALNTLCHNQVCDALGASGNKMHVPFLHRRFRHLLRFSGTTFPPIKKQE